MRFWEERAFSEAVMKHFSFLCDEYRYKCTRSGDTYALFRSNKIVIHISYFSGISHISIEIGHRYLANSSFDALDLLRFKNTQVSKYHFEAREAESLDARMEKLAGLIRENLCDLLRGETGIFRKMKRSRRNVMSFNDYYFQRLGFKKAFYVDWETGRKYTEAEGHSTFGFLYMMGVILCVLAAMALHIPAGYYSLIMCLGVLLYPFKYFFMTFEEYLDPEEEDRYRYW